MRLNRPQLRACAQAARVVAPVFIVQGWKWSVPAPPHVPSQDEIEKAFRRLVRSCLEDHAISSTSGRLRADNVYAEGPHYQDKEGLRLGLELATVDDRWGLL